MGRAASRPGEAGRGPTASAATHEPPRVLLVEDDPDDALLVEHLLEELGSVQPWALTWCQTADAALEALATGDFAACLVDYRLGADDGLEFIERAATVAEEVPLILLTAESGRDIDLAGMRAGAVDFLDKWGLDAATLERTLRYARERQLSRLELLCLARRDPLTGLHNRVSIEERLESALARAERNDGGMGVCLVDLDGFKRVNDVYGHDVGDALLKVIADRLGASVRPYDAVGRIGGDEFVVVLEDLPTEEEGQRVAERIVRAVKPPFGLDRPIRDVSASVGLAFHPRCGASARELLRAADTAMYAAKRGGRARAVVADPPQMNLRPHRAPELSRALDEGEFDVAFQPQIDLQTGDLCGVEVLARWQPPAGSGCPIGELVHELELSGAVGELDLWVLGRAVEELERWPELERISVNLSPVSISTPGMLERIAALLPERPERLELELTESSLCGDPSETINALHVLRALGVRVALDDFGVGASTIERLRQLPVDTLKLDRSLVADLREAGRDLALVGALLAFGARAGIDIVVEGIETAAQESTVRQLGGRHAQGFLYARPLAPRDWYALMNRAGDRRAVG